VNDQILHLHYYAAPRARALPPARRKPGVAEEIFTNFTRGYLLGCAVFGTFIMVGLFLFVVLAFLFA
jgi:hypothetical protein